MGWLLATPCCHRTACPHVPPSALHARITAGREEWLDIARRAFASLDKDNDGELSVDEMIAGLRAKLPDDELRLTIRQAMEEAGQAAGV